MGTAFAFAVVSAGALRADLPPVEPDDMTLSEPALLAQAERLRAAGKLADKDGVAAWLAAGRERPPKLDLPPAATTALEPRAVAAVARRALVRVGWYYRCADCEAWHVDFGGGYALTADGAVATCYHCVDPAEDPSMRAGYLVAMDAEGTLLPVTGLLAGDRVMDAAVVRVAGGRFVPLALSTDVMPGDAVYLLSDPDGLAGYFSAGVVNRFYWKESASGSGIDTLAGARKLRMNVSTEWAPGSSGAALLDRYGNAAGHVSMVGHITQDENEDSGVSASGAPKARGRRRPPPKWCTTMVLHDAVPARALKLLLTRPTEAGD